MKAWRHRDRQLHLIFSGGRFDHGRRLFGQINVILALQQLRSSHEASREFLKGVLLAEQWTLDGQ